MENEIQETRENENENPQGGNLEPVAIMKSDQELAKMYPTCFEVDPENPKQLIRLVGVFGLGFSVLKKKPWKWTKIEGSGACIVKKRHPITGVEYEVMRDTDAEYWLEWPGLESEILAYEADGTLPATTEYGRDKVIKDLAVVADSRIRIDADVTGYVEALRLMSAYHALARRMRTTERELTELKKLVPGTLRDDYRTVNTSIATMLAAVKPIDSVIPYEAVCEAYIKSEDRKTAEKELKKQSIPTE